MDFKQQPEDSVIYNNNAIAKLEVASADLYQNWLIEDNEEIDLFEADRQRAKNDAIERHIYQHYPQTKQTQDQLALTRNLTKLMALEINDGEQRVLEAAQKVLADNITLEAAVKLAYKGLKKTAAKPLLEKLIKCMVRMEWVDFVITEGQKDSTSENDIMYLTYPEL